MINLFHYIHSRYVFGTICIAKHFILFSEDQTFWKPPTDFSQHITRILAHSFWQNWVHWIRFGGLLAHACFFNLCWIKVKTFLFPLPHLDVVVLKPFCLNFKTMHEVKRPICDLTLLSYSINTFTHFPYGAIYFVRCTVCCRASNTFPDGETSLRLCPGYAQDLFTVDKILIHLFPLAYAQFSFCSWIEL